MRRYKTDCIICNKETRVSRYGITSKPIDLCYKCFKENERTKFEKTAKVKG